MKIFIDSANLDEIKKWFDCGIADGVTTNPSIMCKEGVCDLKQRAIDIARLINPKPLSVEVTSNDLKVMVQEGKTFAGWAPNIEIKIPVINQDGVPCLGVIRELTNQGIHINATALLALGQVMLVTKAGAKYASIFAGRIGDEGGNASEVIRSARAWLDLWKYPTEIIVGSMRTIADIQSAAIAGAHILTIPPALIEKLCDHKYTRETVRQFIADAQKTLEKMKK